MVRNAADLDDERLDPLREQLEQVQPLDPQADVNHDVEHLGRAVRAQQRQARGPGEPVEEAQLEPCAGHDPADADDDATRIRDDDVGVPSGEAGGHRVLCIARGGPRRRQDHDPHEHACAHVSAPHANSFGAANARRPR